MVEVNKAELQVDFFIAGAAKCGSSSLAEYLSQHPQICFSYPKEPVYFAEENFESKFAFSWQDYKNCFAPNANHKVVGEGSILYLYSDTAVKNILSFNPKAKFIVILRNPIDQAYSLFLQLRHSDYESENDFFTAWSRESQEGISILNYRDLVSTGRQVKRLLEEVPKEQTLIMTLEQLIDDPRAVYLNMLEFLNVEDDGKDRFERVNETGDHRNAFLRFIFLMVTKNRFLYNLAVNTVRFLKISPQAVNRFHKGKKGDKQTLPQDMRMKMAEELRADVRALEECIGEKAVAKWSDFSHENHG